MEFRQACCRDIKKSFSTSKTGGFFRSNEIKHNDQKLQVPVFRSFVRIDLELAS